MNVCSRKSPGKVRANNGAFKEYQQLQQRNIVGMMLSKTW